MSEHEVWNELGNIYYNAGAYDEAIHAYHRAIELDHGCGQSFNNLADIFIRKEFYGEAILMYQKGIGVLKNSAEKAGLWNRLGDVYLKLGRYGEALQAYQTAVELDPNNAELEDDLAKVKMGSAHLPLAMESPTSENPVELSTPTDELFPEDVMEEAFMEETGGALLEPVAEMSVEAAETTFDESISAIAALEAESRREVEAVLEGQAEKHEPEAGLDPMPPLPAEFRDEESLDGDNPPSKPAVLESEMEAEAISRLAAFFSDLPAADPASPEPDSACWIFQDEPAAAETRPEESGLADKLPLMLGSQLLSEPVTIESTGESIGEATGATENPEPLATLEEVPVSSNVPPFVEEICSTNIQEQLLDIQENLSENADELLPFMQAIIQAQDADSMPETHEAVWANPETLPSCRDISGILAEALPANFEIPFQRSQDERNLPSIEPQMGEPMNSRASALVKLGLLHWRRNDYEGAVQFLKTALNLAGVFFDRPFEALCYQALAMVETDLGNTDEAISAYENAACLDAEHFSPWKDIGYLYSKSSRHDEALEAFKKAIENSPKDSVSWNGLGDVYHKLGRAEDAISAYQLGNLFDRQRHESHNPETPQEPFEPGNQNPRVLEEMGNIHFLNSAFDDAIHAYADAIDLLESPADQARLWRRLGDAYQRLNEDDNAKAAYQQAIQLDRGTLPVVEPASSSEDIPADIATEEADQTGEEIPETTSVEAVPVDEEASDLPESEETIGLEDTQPIPAVEAESIQRMLEPVAETEEMAEPEAAYWFFKANAPARPAAEPSREAARDSEGVRLSADTGLGAVKPSPAFILPKYSNQARLDKPLLSNAYEEPAVMVMEEPRPDEVDTLVETVETPGLTEEETRPMSMGDLQSIQATDQEIDEMEGREFEANGSADAAEKTAGADVHLLESDIAAYRRVTELNPLNDRAWDALGNMYEATGLHSEAIAAFEKAISLASQREVYHYHLGLAHGAQKHYDKAIQSLQKVVALNPDYVLAHCALAGYYRRTGKEAEAREHTVIARPFMESENYYNQACFESICGNTDRAFAFLRNALDKKQVEVELARNDPDLDFIREDPRFGELLNRKEAESGVTP